MLVENPQKTEWTSDRQKRFVLAMNVFASLIKSGSFLDQKADVLEGLCQSRSKLSNFIFCFLYKDISLYVVKNLSLELEEIIS